MKAASKIEIRANDPVDDIDDEDAHDIVLSLNNVVTKGKKTKSDKSKKRSKLDDSADVNDFVNALLGSDDEYPESNPKHKSKSKDRKSKSENKSKKKNKGTNKSKKNADLQSQESEPDLKFDDSSVKDLYAWDSDDDGEEEQESKTKPMNDKNPMVESSINPGASSVEIDDTEKSKEDIAQEVERKRALSLALAAADDAENGSHDAPRDAGEWFEKLEEESRESIASSRKRKRTEKSKNNDRKADTGVESDSDSDMPTDIVKAAAGPGTSARTVSASVTIPQSKKEALGKYLAIDCEMVGAGPKGSRSMLARVSIVNYYGHLVFDEFVKPQEPVTDYRTWVSGIRKSDLQKGKKFAEIQKRVADLFKDRILVGHAISHDLNALMLTHPHLMIRDTSKYSGFKKLNKGSSPSLRKLAATVLNITIQEGEHSSVVDAKTTMLLYRKVKDEWEKQIAPKAYKAKMKRAKAKSNAQAKRQNLSQQPQ